nr:PREDICTED: cytokine receptor-like factor 2 [Lepisosteus oculatus]
MFQLHLLLIFMLQQVGTGSVIHPPENVTVTGKLDNIILKWNTPREGKNCYESNLQYKTQHDKHWQSKILQDFSLTLQKTDNEKCYLFRVRFRYNDICSGSNWSEWSPQITWRNGSVIDSCLVYNYNLKWYFSPLIILIPAVLLYCIFKVKRIRRTFLPQIPDPKHIFEELFNHDEALQCPGAVRDNYSECVPTEIEIICLEKAENQNAEDTMTHSKGSKQDSRRTSSSLGTSSEESSNQTDRFSFPMDNSAYVIW